MFIGGSERFWLIGDPNNNGKAMFPETVRNYFTELCSGSEEGS